MRFELARPGFFVLSAAASLGKVCALLCLGSWRKECRAGSGVGAATAAFACKQCGWRAGLDFVAERFLGWLRVAEAKGAIRRAQITLFSRAGLLPMRRVDCKSARASGLICFSEARTIAIVARGLLLFAI